MSSSTTQTTAKRRQLYRLTNQILNDNSLHFILISLLFLPATFSASAAVKFYFNSSPGTDVTTMFDPFNLFLIKTIIAFSQNLLNLKTIITVLAFACFIILPTVAGVALITYSTNQAIYHTPLTFSSTLKSLSRSYCLLHTILVGSITLITIFFAFTLSPIVVTEAIKALGLHVGQFGFSVFINSIVSYALAITIIFFIVIWGSAAVITVLESKSGFETLRQSASQSTEFRRHSFSIVFITGYGVGTALAYSTMLQNYGPEANWTLILQVGVIYLQSSLMILLYVVANTVLYVQCRAESGEDIVKAAEGKHSGEYVSLVMNDTDDGDVVDEPGEEAANGGFKYMLYLLTLIWVILFCMQLVKH